MWTPYKTDPNPSLTAVLHAVGAECGAGYGAPFDGVRVS